MGQVFPTVPHELALFIRRALGIDVFIETGTFRGDTAFWASQSFPLVVTIERSKELRDDAARKYAAQKNLQFLHGSSPELLATLLPHIDRPALFWLDAHWSGGITSGEDFECPLPQELKVLRGSPHSHAILIDDAKYFLQPPPPPHRIEAWPTIADVVNELQAIDKHYYITVWNDVIVALPERVRAASSEFLRSVS